MVTHVYSVGPECFPSFCSELEKEEILRWKNIPRTVIFCGSWRCLPREKITDGRCYGRTGVPARFPSVFAFNGIILETDRNVVGVAHS